jgi:fatty acid desaturase
MQSFAKPHMAAKRSQALWQAMLETIAAQKLNAPATSRLLWKLPALLTLGGFGLAGAWFADSWVHTVWLVLLWLLSSRCKDPDMDVDLVVSLTEDSRLRKNALGRFLTRCQGLSIWFLSLLFAQSQRHLSQWGVLVNLRTYALDALVLLIHFGLWWGLPLALEVDPLRVLVVYTLPLFFLGPYLAAIFWVNHVGMPLIEKVDSFSFLEHQAVTSRTVVNPRALDWFFGGLNFQIEHHLYPQIPSFRLRQVQSIVRPSLEAEQIPYHAVSFAQAVRDTATHFRFIAKGTNS